MKNRKKKTLYFDLETLMVERNINQKQLAEIIGSNTTQISRWMVDGGKNMKLNVLTEICNELNINALSYIRWKILDD